jgi:cation transport protein ChaC
MTGRNSTIDIAEAGDVWFFAYGSLMWDPGFVPVEVQPARLYGYHRAFCVRSRHYRGTAAAPGVVLGLDRGGSCHGRALRVAERDRAHVFEYLAEREMPEAIYTCQRVRLALGRRRVDGYALVVNRDNFLYAGRLSEAEIARIIVNSEGGRGRNRDYLASTVRHLDDLGIGDGPMHRLLAVVEDEAAKLNPAAAGSGGAKGGSGP